MGLADGWDWVRTWAMTCVCRAMRPRSSRRPSPEAKGAKRWRFLLHEPMAQIAASYEVRRCHPGP